MASVDLFKVTFSPRPYHAIKWGRDATKAKGESTNGYPRRDLHSAWIKLTSSTANIRVDAGFLGCEPLLMIVMMDRSDGYESFIGQFNNEGIILMRFSRITHNPAVMGGKPCIRGLRVTVGTIVGLLASDESRERILAAYPYLEPADIDEALSYAAWRLEEREEELVAK